MILWPFRKLCMHCIKNPSGSILSLTPSCLSFSPSQPLGLCNILRPALSSFHERTSRLLCLLLASAAPFAFGLESLLTCLCVPCTDTRRLKGRNQHSVTFRPGYMCKDGKNTTINLDFTLLFLLCLSPPWELSGHFVNALMLPSSSSIPYWLTWQTHLCERAYALSPSHPLSKHSWVWPTFLSYHTNENACLSTTLCALFLCNLPTLLPSWSGHRASWTPPESWHLVSTHGCSRSSSLQDACSEAACGRASQHGLLIFLLTLVCAISCLNWSDGIGCHGDTKYIKLVVSRAKEWSLCAVCLTDRSKWPYFVFYGFRVILGSSFF